MAKQETYEKFRKKELIQVPLKDPLVSCKRTRLAMIKENNPPFRLPKWKDIFRLQQKIGKRLLLEMLSCSPTSSNTIKVSQFPLPLKKERDECYRDRRPREGAATGGKYGNFASTLKEIVLKNHEISQESERKVIVYQ